MVKRSKPKQHKRRLSSGKTIVVNKGVKKKKSSKWIQKVGLKKGALSKQLGIKEEDKIPMRLLDTIILAKAGDTITNPTCKGKSKIKVTRKLERRAILARNLKRLRGTPRKRYNEKQYKYVSGIIRNTRKENQTLTNRFDRLRDKQNSEITMREKLITGQRMRSLKKQVSENSEKIDRLNNLYFPDNPK